uniref:Uncharacterized protein n=1 Tax=Podoviridae sp. ctsNK10 TaxID=2826582 RepID=A0A8S5NLC3_9CAUD|nr:MAG TPA: hypothetical protein [Podoviridae sp. ctsNK10]
MIKLILLQWIHACYSFIFTTFEVQIISSSPPELLAIRVFAKVIRWKQV